MYTLSRWVERLSHTPVEIECPEMCIDGFVDHEPPIFTGTGTLHLDTPTSFRFLMHARSTDPTDALRRLTEFERSPYEVEHAFRLSATDYDDIEWRGGWTAPRVLATSASGSELLLEGAIGQLSTMVDGNQGAAEPGVELVFSPAPRLPLSEALMMTARIGQTELGGRHVCNVLGGKVAVFRDPWSENLWLTATTSERLQHPFLENWVSEPLRILCGQLVYPRFVARNFGDGHAFVDVRASPSLRSKVRGCAAVVGRSPDAFWSFYQRCLVYLSGARGRDGLPMLQSNPITRLHEEVIQAANGSKWMFGLALASAIEGMCKLAVAPNALPREFDKGDTSSIRKHLEAWHGHEEISRRLLRYVDSLNQPAAGAYLRELVEKSDIRKEHREAWAEVRHPAAHGELGGPWPDEKSDEQFELLLELLYTLTIRVVNSALSSDGLVELG